MNRREFCIVLAATSFLPACNKLERFFGMGALVDSDLEDLANALSEWGLKPVAKEYFKLKPIEKNIEYLARALNIDLKSNFNTKFEAISKMIQTDWSADRTLDILNFRFAESELKLIGLTYLIL